MARLLGQSNAIVVVVVLVVMSSHALAGNYDFLNRNENEHKYVPQPSAGYNYESTPQYRPHYVEPQPSLQQHLQPQPQPHPYPTHQSSFVPQLTPTQSIQQVQPPLPSGYYPPAAVAPPIDPRFESKVRLVHLSILKEVAKKAPADLSSREAKMELLELTIDELYNAHTMRVPYLFNMKFIMLYDKAISRPCSQIRPLSIVHRKHIEELQHFPQYRDRVESQILKIADICKVANNDAFRYEVKKKLEPLIKMSVDKPRSCFGWFA